MEFLNFRASQATRTIGPAERFIAVTYGIAELVTQHKYPKILGPIFSDSNDIFDTDLPSHCLDEQPPESIEGYHEITEISDEQQT